MAREQNDQEGHWDRDQWAKDEPVEKTTANQGETWDRHEWASDEKHPDSPGDDVTTPRGQSPGATGPTGGGMPSGEGHWERVDKEG